MACLDESSNEINRFINIRIWLGCGTYVQKGSLNFLCSESVRQSMQVYLENPDYTYDKVNKASLACGPLVKWAIAQVTA